VFIWIFKENFQNLKIRGVRANFSNLLIKGKSAWGTEKIKNNIFFIFCVPTEEDKIRFRTRGKKIQPKTFFLGGGRGRSRKF
jgi:hypothetical protein